MDAAARDLVRRRAAERCDIAGSDDPNNPSRDLRSEHFVFKGARIEGVSATGAAPQSKC